MAKRSAAIRKIPYRLENFMRDSFTEQTGRILSFNVTPIRKASERGSRWNCPNCLHPYWRPFPAGSPPGGRAGASSPTLGLFEVAQWGSSLTPPEKEI